MSADTRKATLAELCLDVSYGYTASATSDPVGPKFLRITDIQGGVVDWGSVPYCEVDESVMLKNKLVYGDIVIARTGNSTGENYFFDGGEEAVFASYLIRFRVSPKLANPYFVWLQLRTQNWWDFVSGSKSGSAQAGANAKVLGRFELNLPQREVQDHVEKIIRGFNTKLRLNSTINQTLEQIAQAIFKSWFVGFEPVKAKMAARERWQALQPGNESASPVCYAGELDGQPIDVDLDAYMNFAAMQAISGKDAEQLARMKTEQPEQYAELRATAELFPSSMQDSELGEIPEGWEATTFGKVSNCFDRHRVPLSKRQREQMKGSIPYYGATSVMDYVDDFLFDGVYLLLGEDGSVVKDDGAPFIQYIWGKSWVNNHAHVLQGDNGVSTEELLMFLKQQNIAPYVTGAVQLKLNQKNMNSIPFVKADEEICGKFSELVRPMFAEIRRLNEEDQALSDFRDTLLPKFISGELKVAEAS